MYKHGHPLLFKLARALFPAPTIRCQRAHRFSTDVSVFSQRLNPHMSFAAFLSDSRRGKSHAAGAYAMSSNVTTLRSVGTKMVCVAWPRHSLNLSIPALQVLFSPIA